MNSILIRKATLADIDFLIDAIIAAEKSGTQKCGLANILEISEAELREILRNMLEEEIDGCEFSVSSFLIVEIEKRAVATVGGWVEGENEDGLSSNFIKAGLLRNYTSMDKRENLFRNGKIISGIQLNREKGEYELEYVYTCPDFRQRNIVGMLIAAHKEIAIKKCSKMRIQVFGNNSSAIKCYQKNGFIISQRAESDHSLILDFMPDSEKIVMELNIKR